ncbi:unnamed protein product [Prorocentrum cordatum]|uniref:Uncharacterized protein n=1 Tax=Prorocentrum cordatum TaxID=2364126 RepID=A0ABN9WA40_9DINO|nr:unnamed protein product [Polarella glacialis]
MSTFGFLTLVPWSSQDKAANVLATGEGCGEVSSESITRIVEQLEVVFVVSVYRATRENRGALYLLDYLGTSHPDALVFLLQLPDMLDPELAKDYSSTLMARQDEIYSFGAQGVLMELEIDLEGLRQRLSLELMGNDAIEQRVRAYKGHA